MHFNTQLIILFEPIRSHLDIIDVEDLKVIFQFHLEIVLPKGYQREVNGQIHIKVKKYFLESNFAGVVRLSPFHWNRDPPCGESLEEPSLPSLQKPVCS